MTTVDTLRIYHCKAIIKGVNVYCTVLAETLIKAKIKAAEKWGIKTPYVDAWEDQ